MSRSLVTLVYEEDQSEVLEKLSLLIRIIWKIIILCVLYGLMVRFAGRNGTAGLY